MRKLFWIIVLSGLLLFSCQPNSVKDSWTSTLEGQQFKVSALTGGRILRLEVDEGDSVTRGDTLAVLDKREFEFMLEQLNATRNELTAQEELLRTQIAQAGNDLEYQQSRQDRASNLYDADVIPKQTLEDSELLQTKAETQLKAAQQNLALISAKRAQADAQEKGLRKKIADCVITAPSSGMINTLYYREAEIIPPLGQLAQITDTEQIELSIFVDENHLAKLKPGMQANLKIQGNAKTFPATIAHISNKAEFTPKTVLTPDNRSVMVYAVRLKAENPEGILKDGMPVDVTLP